MVPLGPLVHTPCLDKMIAVVVGKMEKCEVSEIGSPRYIKANLIGGNISKPPSLWFIFAQNNFQLNLVLKKDQVLKPLFKKKWSCPVSFIYHLGGLCRLCGKVKVSRYD